jgi:4-methylaminobutanoate oxidase (formaldehyde-forming)
MLWGGELLIAGGAPVGQVTSAAWGETVGACVGLALLRSAGPVTTESLGALAEVTVDVAGERWPVRLSMRAPLS